MKQRTLYRAVLYCAALMTAARSPAFAAPPPKVETLATILARHLRAMGTPDALHTATPRETVYAISAGGLMGTLTEYDAPPHRMRVEMLLGPLHETTGDNGQTAWQQDSTGNVRLIKGPELTEQRAAVSFSLESYDPFKGSQGGKVTLSPQRDPATGDYVLTLTPSGGVEQTIYLDPHTYLLSRLVTRKGGLTGTIVVLAYQVKFGQEIPSKLQIGYAGLPVVVTADLVSAWQGITLNPTMFAVPKPSRDFEFLTAAGTGPATLPFTLQNDEIIIPVVINGQRRRMLLDSGAGTSFLTEQAAEGLNLKMQGSMPAIGYGGSARSAIAAQTTLELPGAVRIKGQLLYVIQDSHVAQALSDRGGVDGAIGYDLLARFAVGIDYGAQRITLWDPATFAPPAVKDVFTLPLKLENRTPTISAAVDGKASGQFLIDTGDSGAVHLYNKYAGANGLVNDPHDPKAHIQTGIGVGGILHETFTPGHTFAFGPVTLTDVPVATMSGPGVTDISYLAGGVGNQALRKFVVTFDYANQRMLLRKTAAWTPSLTPAPTAPAAPVATRTLFHSGPARVRLASYQVAVEVPTAPLTLKELLQKHLAALGGMDAVAAITNTRVTADVTTGGLNGTVTTVYAAPDKEFEEDKLGPLDILQGYDGKNAWREDSNGNTRPLGGDELKNLRNQIYFDTNSYVLPGRIRGSLTLRPQTESGTGNYILDALPEGGKPTTLFIDPNSFFIVKEQHYDDDILMTTTYSDYRRVDGVAFPYKQYTTNGTARYDISLTATKIENNVALPAGLFEAPAAAAKVSFIRPGATTATVPFDMDDGEIALSVTINGQPERVFLDSGASGIALAKKTADALNLKQGGYLEARGYGGSADLTPVKIDSFEVPDAVLLTDITGVSIPLPETLNQFLSHPVAGFVGYDLLSHFVVRVDYAHKRLTFIAPSAFTPTAADGKPTTVGLDNDVPTITAQLDNLPPDTFLIDTGDEAALRLYGPYVAKYKLTQKYPRGVPSVGGGIGGVSNARLTKTRHFTIAGITLQSVPTDFSLDTKGGASQINAGSIGSELLSRFVVTFDYPHGRVFFAPYPGATSPFDTRTMGITLGESDDKKHIYVAGIQDGAPVLKAGLATFDEILQVDGQPVAGIGMENVRRLLSPEGGKTYHTLTVQASIGKPRRVKATLYDPLQ